ncbi:Dienelactone hydrolase [Asanoa hainanensis]|uniref:Dienelactone hydrolase n=1 Tax=Asanoa hainanensis TaxID=560556 RepID=A0A239PE54_9ACTN|nr:dienelactone hydrolase family protein [Asanoa hainanensis]SNT65310.1 Dienelactone hydrolase [Asanoa hainanensis]
MFGTLSSLGGPVSVTQHGVEERGGVLVHDITYAARDGDPVRAYLVEPARPGRYPAVLYLHWFEPPNPTSSRLEFLDEAVDQARQGAVALLPDLTFPWSVDPVGDRRDVANVVAQTVRLRRGLDLLTARPDVDRSRIAVVGHDYGGMYGLLLASVDRDRIHAVVAMNVDATFGNWFATFFLGLSGDATIAYEKLFEPVDPIRYVADRGGVPLLFQFAEPDFFVPDSTRRTLVSLAEQPTDYRLYPGAGHELDAAARADREAWLTSRWKA